MLAFNIRVVSGRVASPGEVLVVVLVVLVVAFYGVVEVVAKPLLTLLRRKPPPGPPKPPPGPAEPPPEPTRGLATRGLAGTEQGRKPPGDMSKHSSQPLPLVNTVEKNTVQQ